MIKQTYKKQNSWNMGCSLFLVAVVMTSVAFAFWLNNTGKYTVQVGETIEIKVNPNLNFQESSTRLILKELGGEKLKFSGSLVWKDSRSGIFYDVENQTVSKLVEKSEDYKEELVKNSPINDIYLTKDGIILKVKGEKIFYIDSGRNYTIKVKNLSNKTAHFKATVTNR
ncbi:hypothetical protein [Streptococcus oricebi]|uniref:Uncharacterized protein n=1 Tax=Streptococcus oricebi TaxID=1547447 RepID=A0ABS5B417_9STRE|nr:hypothetical protein [Streptococcus oricebi]MBP2623550.1 hypothetical protein [Streptococcus oricebi]